MSKYDCGCELKPGTPEYRARARAYDATVKRLKGKARREFIANEARKFRQTMARCNHR